MLKLFIRWIIIAISLVVAAWLIPGITVSDTNGWIAVGVMAAVLGFVNAIIRPLLAFFSCGCIVLTMGLFMLVINAAMLSLCASSLTGIYWNGDSRGKAPANTWRRAFLTCCVYLQCGIAAPSARRELSAERR